MPVTHIKIKISESPAKRAIGRASYSVRLSGKNPEWFHTKDEALTRKVELERQHHNGGIILKAESGTLRAAVELYAESQKQRVAENKIGYQHGYHSRHSAYDWIETKRAVLKDDCLELPADHWKLKRRKHIKEHVIEPRLFEGVEVGAIKCSEISAADIKDWLVFFAGRSDKTKREKLTSLQQAFDIAVDQKWAHHNPARGVKLEATKYGETELEAEAGTIERLPVDKIRELIKAAIEVETTVGNTPWCDGLALSFAAQTGLRFSELAALKWKFIDLDKKRVYVRTAARKSQDGTRVEVGITKSVKSGQISKSRRSVFLTANLIAALKEWKLRSPLSGDDDRVFLTHRLRMHETSEHLRRNVLHPACDKVGLERIRFHDLRHFFASLCVAKYGAKWDKIADRLGHESSATTRKHYAEWIEDVEGDEEDAEDFNDTLWGAA